ncbi:HIT family protein [Halalkalicoccus subterraneus]|uniref:HIT family protein n=1 Tax=Halalkalicoccus subterraneus TaxID=2675002 RepID=UPI000EFB6E23|nr:HIT domain-containing protein [Halalkalicoccus subterraneus]
MDQMFAPWRIEWVERDTPEEGPECVFCAFEGEDDDRENRVVARNEHAFVLLNNYPYNPGHVMVIPTRHTGDYTALPEDQLLDHSRLKQRTFEAFEAAFSPDGVNAGYNLGRGAGGSINDHLHAHVVPRWEGDTNFMPVIGETKVIVQALEETYDRLYDAFAGLDGADTSGEGAVRFG